MMGAISVPSQMYFLKACLKCVFKKLLSSSYFIDVFFLGLLLMASFKFLAQRVKLLAKIKKPCLYRVSAFKLEFIISNSLIG